MLELDSTRALYSIEWYRNSKRL